MVKKQLKKTQTGTMWTKLQKTRQKGKRRIVFLDDDYWKITYGASQPESPVKHKRKKFSVAQPLQPTKPCNIKNEENRSPILRRRRKKRIINLKDLK